MIKIEGLVKNYGLNPVLRGVNLSVAAGEFVSLVGSNGAGKTTLIRIVATLIKPGEGLVEVGGWTLPKYAHKIRRHIGFVSHHSLLYPDLTANENLAFYARLYGLKNRDQLALAALKAVGLSARQRDPVSTFSRGMLQRLTIARATLHEPDVLLLDEPYTGLDQEASGILESLLQQEKARGRTILMITHDFSRGLNLCDRIAVLNRGKIITEVARTSISQGDFLALYTEITRADQPRL